MTAEKGIHYLIDAFNEIKTDKKLVIAGGSSHTGNYMAEISKMAEKDSRVVMTHFVQGRQLEELFSNAYCFVLPSDIEGMAISLLEAMSYGNCCVVSDIPENTEVVKEQAISFEKGNVEDLQRVMEYLLANPNVVDKYKSESQEYICSRFNWDDIVDTTMKIYQNVREK